MVRNEKFEEQLKQMNDGQTKFINLDLQDLIYAYSKGIIDKDMLDKAFNRNEITLIEYVKIINQYGMYM